MWSISITKSLILRIISTAIQNGHTFDLVSMTTFVITKLMIILHSLYIQCDFILRYSADR